MLERGGPHMFRTAVYALIYLGSFLMIYNIYCFIRFAGRIRKLDYWGSKNIILNIPISLLILFLIGYLIVGFFGNPDLVIAGILFFGSIFVYVMYWMISRVTDRILENEQIEAKLMASEEASNAKITFLASISHEMRTPMNVILGLTELALKEPDLKPKMKLQLEKIDQSGQHLLGLINHILEINNIDTGELVLKTEPFRLPDILTQLNATTRTLCENKGLVYRYLAPDELPECCEGDGMKLKNLLLGLLDNAVKYTDAPGNVTFSVNCKPEDGRAKLVFTVADTGIGISEEFIARIFDPFAQEDASFTNRFGGSGLSLAVSKKLADLMGADLEVQSEKGKGSVFTLTVSLPVLEDCAPKAASTDDEEVSLAGRRILVVEDVPENAEIVQDLLELEDVVTDHAENGLVALERFESSPPGTYDAILMDLRMPVMDGLEATRRIRALPCPDSASIPIIALTANAFQNDVEATHDAGMNAHLAKPTDADQLYETIKQCIAVAQKQKGGTCHD